MRHEDCAVDLYPSIYIVNVDGTLSPIDNYFDAEPDAHMLRWKAICGILCRSQQPGYVWFSSLVTEGEMRYFQVLNGSLHGRIGGILYGYLLSAFSGILHW